MKLGKFISELKRRNVVKAIVAYLAVAWVVIQIASIVLPTFNAPNYILKGLMYFLAVGLVIWSGFAWVYEWTSEGFKKTDNQPDHDESLNISGQRLNQIIIASLLVVIALLLVNQIFLGKKRASDRQMKTVDVALRTYSNSIAVLAFKDLSQNYDQGYFSDGISEGILSLLTKIPDLKVISSASSFLYKDRQKPIPSIGEELDVNYILDGSVLKSDSVLRITTRLIDAGDGTQIWGRTFDRRFSDVFQIQDEIANTVASQLKLTFSGDHLNSPTTDFEAYNFFLEASYLYNEFTPESLVEADAFIRNSISIDSTFSDSWVLLARIIDRRWRNFSQLSPEESETSILGALDKALALNPRYAEAYAVRASFEAQRLNYETAQSMLMKAREIEPLNPVVVSNASLVNFYLGNLEKSLQIEHEVLAIDPLEPRNYFSLGLNYYFVHDFDKALEYFEKYDYLKPESALHHMLICVVLTLKGDYEKALSHAEMEPAEWANLFAQTNAYYGLGNLEHSDSLLQVLIEKYGNTSPNIVAASWAWRSDKDRAFEWLNKTYDVNKQSLTESINWVYFSKLYDDPRWAELLNKMDLPEEHWILKSIH